MEKLNAQDLKMMFSSGCANLANHAAEVNALNVFPVPDGDTGSNMSMTVDNGYKEVLSCTGTAAYEIAKSFSRGLLMGARGNSGVITSQIFRGFYQRIDGMDEIDAKTVAEAFENGAVVAYKAIMKPVEGTILTVIREASWYANHDFEKNPGITIKEYFENLCRYAKESLDTTPELLPVLKEVGVVDSGGQGLLYILEGMKAYVDGNPYTSTVKAEDIQNFSAALEIENEEFGYCTEFILRLSDKYKKDFDENILKTNLTKIGGESLVVVKDDDLVKVHVHMMKPGEALNIGQRYGEFIKLKIENMQEQHSTIIAESKKEEATKQEVKEAKKYGVITVCSGKGLEDLFNQCGVDKIISGGQTMNPSTEDFLKAIEELTHCENILIFPNNSNIILAANQAKDLFPERNITVVETKSIQAGFAALSSFNPDGSLEDNLAEFESVISTIKVGSITYAIKDTSFEGVDVKEGDFIAMVGKKIVHSSTDKMETIYRMLDELFKDNDSEVLLVLKGEDGNDEEVSLIEKYTTETSEFEVEAFDGDQPVYSYLFATL